jgi:hypothetical protein
MNGACQEQMGRSMSTQNGNPTGRFAFVVPVVHPGGKKVSDYAVVERALKETLRSYTRQDHGDAVVIVVCHRLPAWASEFRGSVRFLRIETHPRFDANVNDVNVDKGMKYVLGSLSAMAEGAAFVMLADGDDFVRTDLASRVFSRTLSDDRDGFIIRQGYNAMIGVEETTFRVQQVYRVQDFDRTCGTCRIFSRASLARTLERLEPGILGWGDRLVAADGLEIVADAALLSELWEVTAPVVRDPTSTIQAFGRHDRQGSVFALQPLFEPLAAKACGHGNHDGPRRGGIRWSGVRGCADGAVFLEQFGLAGGDIALGRVEPGLWLRGTAFGALNTLRQRFNIRFGYEKRHALGLKPAK